MVRGWFAYTEASKGRSLLSMIKELALQLRASNAALSR